MNPLVTYPSILVSGGIEKHVLMSDLLFKTVKEHAGKLRHNEGFVTSTGTLATLTANTGKDMYVIGAEVTFVADTVTSSSLVNTAELQVNGVVVETAVHSHQLTAASGGADATHHHVFVNLGHKVPAGQAIRIQVTVLNASVRVEGSIQCIEEDTGVSPFVASEFQ